MRPPVHIQPGPPVSSSLSLLFPSRSGIVPSSFRILRNVLNRIEDPKTGKVDKAFHVDIPKKDRAQAKEAAGALGNSIYEEVGPSASFSPT
jgi:hypothetical protein